MLVVLAKNHEELSREAALMVANAVRHNPATRLGLATGSTTLGVYRELARLHREFGLRCASEGFEVGDINYFYNRAARINRHPAAKSQLLIRPFSGPI